MIEPLKNVVETLTSLKATEDERTAKIAEWRAIYNSTDANVTLVQKLNAAKNLVSIYESIGNNAASQTWRSNRDSVQKNIWIGKFNDTSASLDDRKAAAQSLIEFFKENPTAVSIYSGKYALGTGYFNPASYQRF